MAKTTNILDLNNRLEKVEKENVAQNSYTSLKNKPKINNVTLTGNKSLADIGAASADDLTNINDEILAHKRYNGGDLWPGNILTFNISASSNTVYHFMAFDTTAAGTPESAYLIVKETGTQVYGKVGTFTTAYDAEHEILTITLPSSSYWDYRFEVVAKRNG